MPVSPMSISGATIPKPQITPRGVLIATLCWLLYTTFYSFMVVTGNDQPLSGVLAGQLISSIIMAVLSIPPWLLIVRNMESRSWSLRLVLHCLIAPAYAWITLELFLWIIRVLVSSEVEADIRTAYMFVYGSHLTAYIVQFTLYHSFRMMQRLRIKEKQTIELRALARERELAALKAQINPHFLFNTLNSISAMVTRDTEVTREMIMQLGDLLRYALDSSRRDWVPLSEEIEFARAYLDLEKHRFMDRLRVEFVGTERAREVLVPPMVLQPLVENAVKHGISKSENGGTIRVSVDERDDRVEVTVEDTGASALVSDGSTLMTTGIGIENTRARLEKSLGPAAKLFAEALPSKGFRAGFFIPQTDLA